MTDSWRRIEELFHALAALPPEERERRLASEDLAPELREELVSLLQAQDRDADFLERPAFEVEAPDPASPSAPTEIGPYRILGAIGSGGMGIVYEAQSDRPKRRVAIKILRSLPGEDLRLFRREIDALARLQHPGIAALYEAGATEEGRPYFVMEPVRGRRLDEYVEAHRLDLTQRLELFLQLCEAIGYAHQRGVLHRDLKPANILVRDDEGTSLAWKIKVLDFGLARITDSDGQQSLTASSPGLIRGTLAYMSPEQASGSPADVDVRSDVYSLGVVLYELCTGRLPREMTGVSWTEAMRRLLEDDPIPPRRARPRLPRDLETILLTALASPRDRRYASIQELASDVQSYLEGRPIQAWRDSSWYVLRKTLWRHKAATLAGLAFLAVILGAAIWLAFLYDQERAASEQAIERAAIARRRFEDGHQLADWVIHDFNDLVADYVGSVTARRALVERGQTYLDDLRRDVGDEPELLRSLASSYLQLGRIWSDLHAANAGDVERGLQATREGHRLLQKLHREDPESDALGLELASSHRQLGDMLRQAGRLEDALSEYRASWEQARQLGALEAARPGRWIARERIGDLLALSGDNAGARREYEAALEAIETALSEGAAPPSARRDLAVARLKIGDVALLLGDSTGARQSMDAALEIFEELASDQPDSLSARRDVAGTITKLVPLLMDAGEHREAKARLELALETERELLQRDPQDLQLKHSIALHLRRLGEVATQEGDAEAARPPLEESVRYFEELRQADERSAVLQRDAALSSLRLASVELHDRRLEEARSLADEALELLRPLVAADAPDMIVQRLLTFGLSLRSSVALQEGRPDVALEMVRESVRSRERLAAAHPDHALIARDVASGYGELGKICQELGRWEEAGDSFDRETEHWQRLVEEDSSHSLTLHRSLARSRQRAAECYVTRAKEASESEEAPRLWVEARERYEACRRHLEGLRGTSLPGLAATIRQCDERLAMIDRALRSSEEDR